MDLARYCYEYPRPSVSADIAVFAFDRSNIQILLIKRGNEPFKDKWALPGGFLEMDETIEKCAVRELFEETAIDNASLEQFYTFSSINRDPRGRVLTVAFWSLIEKDFARISAGDDAAKAEWYLLNELPELAFDHAEIISKAIEKLLSLKQYNDSAIAIRFNLMLSSNLNLLKPALEKLDLH
jgi:8-oxo-dGTP diphosphatase